MIKLNLKKIKFNSLLFIGDPHISSIQISKRNDDESTMETVLNKLEQAAVISHLNKSYTIILGDLFDRDNEHNINLLTKLVRVLKKFYYKPITIIGNHEKTETEIVDKNMVMSLYEAGIIDIISNNEISVQLEIEDAETEDVEQIEIGGTNYGSKIPHKVNKKSKNTNKVIWITHHDLIFKQFYPNSLPLHEIDGVCLVVNGHMHRPQPQVQMGLTTWTNPGNILRQTIDLKNNIPSVFLFTLDNFNKSDEKLIKKELEYKNNIFIETIVIEPTETQDFNLEQNNSNDKLEFVKLIEMATKNDNNKTNDKELLKDNILSYAKSINIPDDIISEIYNCADEVLNNDSI